MTSTARNRLVAIVALLLAGAGLAYVSFGNLGENLVYFWTPKEALAQGQNAVGATIRLGGVVRPDSVKWDAASTRLEFLLAEDHTLGSVAVPVVARTVPPQMFRAGIGVVVEGTMDAKGTFSSDRLLVNHSNEYRAPKEGEKPVDWKKTVEGGDTTTAGVK
jgi:cytochrome c-type biogenesis protein CcmE